MHTCSMLCAYMHAYMHIYACTHAYMRVCAERHIFLTDAVCLDGNRGTICCFRLPPYPTFTRSSTTRLATAAVHSNPAAVHYIHYTVMCSEAPLSKRRQSGGWAMSACSEALSRRRQTGIGGHVAKTARFLRRVRRLVFAETGFLLCRSRLHTRA